MSGKYKYLLASVAAVMAAGSTMLPLSAKAGGGTSIASAPQLPLGTQVAGGTGGHNEWRPPDEFWRVELQAGDQLAVEFEGGPGQVSLCLLAPSVTDYTLESSRCTEEVWSGVNDKGQLAYTAPSDGQWTLRVAVNWCCGDPYNYGLTARVSSKTEPPAVSSSPSPLVMVGGDSYAAGVGTQSLPVTGSGCHRSDSAWPNLLPYPVVNAACSGARIRALFSRYQGEAPQIRQFKEYQPDAALLVVGGNDAGFSTALYNCFRYNCASGKLNRNGVAIGTLDEKLAGAYVRVAKALPAAKLFVIGYPRIFPASGQPIVNCGWLSGDERLMLNHMAIEVNGAIAEAVKAANALLGNKRRVRFISTWNTLGAHELCSHNSWVFKLTPLCLKDARCGHPTAPGQEAIAQVVRSYLKKHLG